MIVSLNNLFTKSEIDYLYTLINDDIQLEPNEKLGRHYKYLMANPNFEEKIENLIGKIFNMDLKTSHVLYVKYSNENGFPNLPPHLDGDSNELVIDYQLDSNIDWGLGVNLKVYDMENNSALVFNANKNIHWRPKISFNDNDYVKMLFIRLKKKKDQENYNYLPMSITDKIYREANRVRDKLAKDMGMVRHDRR